MKQHTTLIAGALLVLASCTADPAPTTTASEAPTSSTTSPTTTTSTTLQPTTSVPPTTSTAAPPEELFAYYGPTSIHSRDGAVYLQGTATTGVEMTLAGAVQMTAEGSGNWWFDLQLGEGTHELTLIGSRGMGVSHQLPITVIVNPDYAAEFAYVAEVVAGPDGLIVTADYARFLTGEEANEAARAAGEIGEDETVPNDYYIVNENPRLRELAVHPDAPVSLQACLVDGPCVTPLAVDQSAWVALVTGGEAAGLPSGFQWYGTGFLPYWLTLDGDTIVQIDEQYLP